MTIPLLRALALGLLLAAGSALRPVAAAEGDLASAPSETAEAATDGTLAPSSPSPPDTEAEAEAETRDGEAAGTSGEGGEPEAPADATPSAARPAPTPTPTPTTGIAHPPPAVTAPALGDTKRPRAAPGPARESTATRRPFDPATAGRLPTLESLAGTRERPLFVPGRRGAGAPEPTAEAAPSADIPPIATAPPLALVLRGAVIGPGIELAILTDPANGAVTRLATGEEHDGWKLETLEPRRAVFRRGDEETVLELAPPGVGGSPPAAAPDHGEARPPPASRPARGLFGRPASPDVTSDPGPD